MEEKESWFQVSLPFTQSDREALQRVKKELGISKGHYLRTAMREKLEKERQAEVLNK